MLIAATPVEEDSASSADKNVTDTTSDARATIRVDDIPSRIGDAADAFYAGRMSDAIALSRDLIRFFDRAVEQNPSDPSLRHRLVLAVLLAGDHEGYRRACAATLEHFGGSDSPLFAEAARACLVGPDAGLDPAVPLLLAKTALSHNPNVAWLCYVLGLAEFRAGQYEQAVEHLNESLKPGTAWGSAPLAYPVLAMAHHRLGHDDESRRWLEKAHGRRGHAAHILIQGDARNSPAVWWDYVEFGLLLREADALVLDTGFPADPFAH